MRGTRGSAFEATCPSGAHFDLIIASPLRGENNFATMSTPPAWKQRIAALLNERDNAQRLPFAELIKQSALGDHSLNHDPYYRFLDVFKRQYHSEC